MSGGVVCYVERTPGGAGIRRLRLIAAGLSREWTAPEGRSVSSIDGSAGSSVAAARSGAQWIAETLDAVGLKRLAALCIDAEGSICTWLSASSSDPSVVKATIVQAGIDADGSGAGVGAARLLALADNASGSGGMGGGIGMDTSVQALATLEPDAPRQGLSFKKKAPVALPRKQRLAVLAVQDSVARVLLDELDSRGIETERVVSLWHAMASAWDRSQPASLTDRLVSADSPGGAVILVEPTGRLVWAWTRAGELVAGGAMRLATRSRTSAQPASESLSTLDSPRPAAEPSLAIDFSTPDAGRLAIDWLSWSAQLGHCPERVVCLAVPGIDDPANTVGPQALFANLARAWPNATIDGAVHQDPIGATIARLAGLGPEERRPAAENKAEALPYHARPREALADLTARPGRADRRLHQWIGVSLCAAAALVAVGGWRLGQSAGLAQDELDTAKKDRTDAIASAAASANVALGPKPLESLETALRRVREQNKSLKAPRPLLSETVRLLAAVGEVEAELAAAAPPPPAASPDASATPDHPPADQPDDDDPTAPPTAPPIAPGSAVAGAPAPAAGAHAGPPKIVMTDLELSQVAAKAVFMVPDASTGPSILERVQAKLGILRWEGSTPGGALNQPRQYTLIAPWPADDARPTGGTAVPSSGTALPGGGSASSTPTPSPATKPTIPAPPIPPTVAPPAVKPAESHPAGGSNTDVKPSLRKPGPRDSKS